MAEFPADILKNADEAATFFMAWVEGGNTTASLSEHAISGLKQSFASAILAERKRCLNVCAAEREWGDFDASDVMDRIKTGSQPRQIQGWNCDSEDGS